MQLDHLSPSIYHNILIIIAILVIEHFLKNGFNKYQKQMLHRTDKNKNPWWNRIVTFIVAILIIILGFNIFQTGQHDYQVQTKNYQHTRQINVNQVKTLTAKITQLQNTITFNQVKMNQPNQSDHQIKKLIQKVSTDQNQLTKLKAQLKTAQTNVNKISPKGTPQ